MEHLEAVHGEQMREARERIIAQMLVVDRVVLQLVEQADQIMRFRDELAVGRQQVEDALDDRMYVLDMREAIGGSDDLAVPAGT